MTRTNWLRCTALFKADLSLRVDVAKVMGICGRQNTDWSCNGCTYLNGVHRRTSPPLTIWSRTSLYFAVTKILSAPPCLLSNTPLHLNQLGKDQGPKVPVTQAQTLIAEHWLNRQLYIGHVCVSRPLSGRPSVTMHLGKIFLELLLTRCVGWSIKNVMCSCKRVFDKMKWAMSPHAFIGLARPRLFFLQKVWMHEPRRSPINWSIDSIGCEQRDSLASGSFNQGRTCAIVSNSHVAHKSSLCETAAHYTPGWHRETQRLFGISFAYLEGFSMYSLESVVRERGRAVINRNLQIRRRILRDSTTPLK